MRHSLQQQHLSASLREGSGKARGKGCSRRPVLQQPRAGVGRARSGEVGRGSGEVG